MHHQVNSQWKEAKRIWGVLNVAQPVRTMIRTSLPETMAYRSDRGAIWRSSNRCYVRDCSTLGREARERTQILNVPRLRYAPPHRRHIHSPPVETAA